MKRILSGAAAVFLIAGATFAVAELKEGYVSVEPAAEDHPLDEIISGYQFRIESTRETQDDDFENPGMLLLDQAMDTWTEADGAAGKSCADCHGDDPLEAMKGVGSTYPKFTEEGDHRAFRNIENQINHCRTERMQADAWKYDKGDMLGMTILARHADRGEPVNVAVDGDAAPYFEQGKELYYTRMGQLDMSCAHCHEENYGNYIRADHLSQGQINGFPTYRFKWQGVGSTHRRFKGCIKNIRGTPYKVGEDEFLALELYTAWRGQGLPIETPAVRN